MPVLGPPSAAAGWDVSDYNEFTLQPITDQDRVYVSRSTDFQSPTGSEIKAYGLQDGGELWSIALPLPAGSASNINRPVAVRDGRLYATRAGYPFGAQSLFALDPDTGSILWESEDLVEFSHTNSPVFAPNGDLLVCGNYAPGGGRHTLRIDATDGSTVWRSAQPVQIGSACGVVTGGALYRIWFSASGSGVGRYDITDGSLEYSSPMLSAGATPDQDLMAGADGTIYWPLTNSSQPSSNMLVALEDTGIALVQGWSVPLPAITASSFAEQADGSIISYSTTNELLRLDPQSGAELDRSSTLGMTVTSARLSTDAAGSVFLTASGQGAGPHRLFAFDDGLNVLWTRNLSGVGPVGGATLAPDGRLLVSTWGYTLKTWESPGSCISDRYCVATVNSTGSACSLHRSGSLSIQLGDLFLRADHSPSYLEIPILRPCSRPAWRYHPVDHAQGHQSMEGHARSQARRSAHVLGSGYRDRPDAPSRVPVAATPSRGILAFPAGHDGSESRSAGPHDDLTSKQGSEGEARARQL
ncbi:MAG: hypothetical protein ACI835_005955 [Planctomycetota bacterium]|jgi:hypothetical protein